jgi:flagellar FliL protein
MSNKLLFIVLGVVLLLVVGMGGGLFMMWTKMSAINTQIATAAEGKAGQKPASQLMVGPIMPLDTFIVNLADAGGKRFLRVTIDLELSNAEMQDEMKTRLPQVRDAILMILPTKQFDDISTTEGKVALRDELLASLNGLLTTGQISNIYFKEFVVQ